jgi:hypothetical protein
MFAVKIAVFFGKNANFSSVQLSLDKLGVTSSSLVPPISFIDIVQNLADALLRAGGLSDFY